MVEVTANGSKRYYLSLKYVFSVMQCVYTRSSLSVQLPFADVCILLPIVVHCLVDEWRLSGDC